MSAPATAPMPLNNSPAPRIRLRSDLVAHHAAILFFLVARLAFGLLLLVTSIYCLLLYIPFSYFGFIHNPILWWLPAFVHLHARLYAISLCAVALTLIPDLRNRNTRVSAAAFILLNSGVCIYLAFVSSLDGLSPDFASYLWSMLCLFPLCWLGAIDFAAAGSSVEQLGFTVPGGVNLGNACVSGILAAVAFAVASLFRGLIDPIQHLPVSIRLFGWLSSVAAHFTIFTIIGAWFWLARQIALRSPRPNHVYFTISRLLAWMLCSAAISNIALSALSFRGAWAAAVAAVIAFAFLLSVESMMARLKVRELALGARAWTGIAACFLVVAFAVPAVIARTDWDFVLQKLLVLLLWTSVFLCRGKLNFFWNAPGRRTFSWVALVVVLATMVGFRRLNSAAWEDSSWNTMLEAYAGSDISFKTASDILSRVVENDNHDAFYKFLEQRTNISKEIQIPPANVALVSYLAPTPANKPNIFLFVIDSLRQDYVPPYSNITFTPAIASFAQDSIVFRKAFTRYAGTALSEPAIWVGAMQVHQQYVQPFFPMNNLEALLQTDGYESFVSVDPILGLILSPSFPNHRLNQNTKMWGELDLVPTLAEIERDLDARTDPGKPIFVYTQPQNVHTVTLETHKHGSTRQEMSIYELRRMDKAFGEFVQFLKSRGLYDNSIIVLTSDHGDSYGEFGRYGHSDFLFPEVIRIPLIVHTPAAIRHAMVYDPRQIAFSLDITPTLYYLLGHRPLAGQELFGRPLLTETQAEQQAYLRDQYLVASSYAPVYGILGDNGDSLFITDAVNRKNYYYDLKQDPLGTQNHVNAKRQDAGEKEIRRQLLLIDQLYHLHLEN